MKGLEARATALLAGNGFMLTKYYDRYIELIGEPAATTTYISMGFVVLFTVIGIGCAYSLFGIAKGELARFLAEGVAIMAFVLPILAWTMGMFGLA